MSDRHTDRIYASLVEGRPLGADDAEHLTRCPECREAAERAQRFSGELKSALTRRGAEPLPADPLDAPGSAPVRTWSLLGAAVVIMAMAIGTVVLAPRFVAGPAESAAPSPAGTPPASSPPVAASPTSDLAECGAGRPPVTGRDTLLVYLLCGDEAALFPVERPLSADRADQRIREAVRLLLAGPTEEERAAGFAPVLSPGDLDIVSVTNGAVVLNFPTEVSNVSTSAGSSIVLTALRDTLFGLPDVSTVELRLRDDCAEFFAWIGAGPTCNVLTFRGLVPALSWSHQPLPTAEDEGFVFVNDVVQGGPGLVAVGMANDACCAEGDPRATRPIVWRSTTGASWAAVAADPALEATRMMALAATPMGLIAIGGEEVGDTASPQTLPAAWWSLDGSSWERATLAGDTGDDLLLEAVAFDGTRLVAIGTGRQGPGAYTSIDGRSWEPIGPEQLDLGSSVGLDIAAGPVGFAIIGHVVDGDTGRAVAWRSADGLHWTPASGPPALENGLWAVDFFAGRFVAVAANGVEPTVWRSEDGDRWAPVNGGLPSLPSLVTVAAGDEGLLAAGSLLAEGQAVPAAWFSPDGTTWTALVEANPTSGGGEIRAAVVVGDEPIGLGYVWDESSIPSVWRANP